MFADDDTLVDAPLDTAEIAPVTLPAGPAHRLRRRRRWWPLVAVLLVGSTAAGWSVGEATRSDGGQEATAGPRPQVIEGLDLDPPSTGPTSTTATTVLPPAPTTAPEPTAELIADTGPAVGQAPHTPTTAELDAPPPAPATTTPAVVRPVPATTTTTAPAPCTSACPDGAAMDCNPAYKWASDGLWYCQLPPCDNPRVIPDVGWTCDPEPTA